MAKIKKIQSGAKSSFIWMGTCDDEECQDFDLTSYADGESNAGIISSVFQMGDNNVAGVWKSDQPSYANDLNDGSTDNNKMLCGKNYFIKLHRATSGADEAEIEISGAIFDYKGLESSGKLIKPDSSKPVYLPDLSSAFSVITKHNRDNFIKPESLVSTRTSDSTETAPSKGMMVKPNGTFEMFVQGAILNILSGAKVFFDELLISSGTSGSAGSSGSSGSAGSSGSSGSAGSFGNRVIAGGDGHSLIVKSDGSLHGFGDNSFGQLANGTTTNGAVPTEILGAGVSQVSAGDYHCLILKQDGSLQSFGRNNYKQLGDQTTYNRYFPVDIDTVYYPNGGLMPSGTFDSGVSQISAGGYHSLILKSDGSLYSFGYNTYGQLGRGNFLSTGNPMQILDSGVAQISAGRDHSLILKTDGSLHGFGYNSYGQLGNGTTTNQSIPTEIYSSGVAQIFAGGYHSLILKTDGSLHGMGDNQYGQLGIVIAGARRSNIPVQILPPGSGVAQISGGKNHSFILKTDGSLHAFGKNDWGQLGDGTTTDTNSKSNGNTPTQIVASGVSEIAGGGFHSMFVKSDGSLYTFGMGSAVGASMANNTRALSPLKILDAGAIATGGSSSSSGSAGSSGSSGSAGSSGSSSYTQASDFPGFGSGTPTGPYINSSNGYNLSRYDFVASSGGSVSLSSHIPNLPFNEARYLSASPDSGYVFDRWTVSASSGGIPGGLFEDATDPNTNFRYFGGTHAETFTVTANFVAISSGSSGSSGSAGSSSSGDTSASTTWQNNQTTDITIPSGPILQVVNVELNPSGSTISDLDINIDSSAFKAVSGTPVGFYQWFFLLDGYNGQYIQLKFNKSYEIDSTGNTVITFTSGGQNYSYDLNDNPDGNTYSSTATIQPS